MKEESLASRDGSVKEGYIPIVSWLYPGAIVRHETIRKDNQYFSSQRCQVMLYGKLMKKSKLRNPVEIQDFQIRPKILQTYQLSNRYLPKNKLIKTEFNFLVRLNLIRGIIADNLLNQKSIGKNLWLILKQQDPLLKR